jgi:hypothetical protein
MRRDRWQTHLLVILIYTLLAVALTWPLAAHFGSHVPGDGADDPPLTWNLWWVQHALLDLGTNPFDCDYLFHPLGINLAFYTLTILNGLLSVPLQAVVGLVPTSNLLLLSSFVLGGYGTFLLATYLVAANERSRGASRRPASSTQHVAALTAGLLYAFASNKLFYAALGQWNIASSQWIPFYILYLLKTGDRPRCWHYPLLAALFLLFQAYAELTYASFLVLFTALWLVWRVVILFSLAGTRPSWSAPADQGKPRKSMRRLVANVALVGAIFVMGLIPVLAMMIPDLKAEGDIFVEGGGFADVFSADLLGFLIPTMYHPLFGSLVERFDFDHTVGQHLYLGYSVLALALVGAVVRWRRSTVKFWVVSAFFFWLLTLGPRLRINGHDTAFPLPFALVAQLPFFKGNRYPSRYGVLLTLSLSVLVAFGAYWLLEKVATDKRQRAPTARQAASGRKAVAACFLPLAAVLLFESLSVPLPLSDMRVPPIYQAIAAEMPDDSALLDLPVAWRNGFRVTGTQHPIIMFEQYYQTVHGQRILAGNTSRNPPLKFQYFTEAPVINTLIALETSHHVDPTIVQADREMSPDVLRFFNIGAIIIHPQQAGPEVVSYVEEIMPVERIDRDGQIVAYRVELPPWPERWIVDPDDELRRLSYAEGWGVPASGVNWAQRRAVRLLVPLNGQRQQMTFRAYAPEGGQRLQVEVNGRTEARIGMGAGWIDYEANLPADIVREGLNEIWLRFDSLYPARDIRLSPRAIGQAGESPVNLVVQSAGQEVGDFGHIYVDGREISPNGRGYNVAVIHPKSGAVEGTAAFDTHLDETASQALAAFVGNVPPGYVVALAVADEASRLLSQEAVDALRGIGAAGDLRGKFRWGHAIIGVQGVPPSAALEALDSIRPVALVTGEGITEPYVAAAFATITFTAESGP